MWDVVVPSRGSLSLHALKHSLSSDKRAAGGATGSNALFWWLTHPAHHLPRMSFWHTTTVYFQSKLPCTHPTVVLCCVLVSLLLLLGFLPHIHAQLLSLSWMLDSTWLVDRPDLCSSQQYLFYKTELT